MCKKIIVSQYCAIFGIEAMTHVNCINASKICKLKSIVKININIILLCYITKIYIYSNTDV